MTSHPAESWRVPPSRSLLLMVGGVWDIAWHRTRGHDTFWSPPHLVLYSGIGVIGFVCLATVRRTTSGRRTGPGTGSTWVEFLGLWALRGFWSPPHLFAIAAAGAIRLGLVVALVDEISLMGPTLPRQRLVLSWPRTTPAEGVLLVLFSILLGNLLFTLGAHEFRSANRTALLYPLLASLVLPVVLVAVVRTLGRIGAGAGIVLVLLAFQALLRAGLRTAGFELSPPWPLWPLYLVPALVVDGWYGLVRRCPRAAWHDGVAGLLFAAVFIGMVYGEAGSHAGGGWSLDALLTALLVGVVGAASGWAGAQLYQWLLTAGPAVVP